MARKRAISYTGDDLIEIGRIVNRVTKRLRAFEAYSGSNIENNVDELRIDIIFEGEAVGFLAYEDGWIGFSPYSLSLNGDEQGEILG